MTFREKLRMEHPNAIDPRKIGGCVGCPYTYGYESHCPNNDHTPDISCIACWDREIPGTEPTSKCEPNNYEKIAVELKGMYTAFRNSGFTDEQALELTKSIIAAGVALTKN